MQKEIEEVAANDPWYDNSRNESSSIAFKPIDDAQFRADLLEALAEVKRTCAEFKKAVIVAENFVDALEERPEDGA